MRNKCNAVGFSQVEWNEVEKESQLDCIVGIPQGGGDRIFMDAKNFQRKSVKNFRKQEDVNSNFT